MIKFKFKKGDWVIAERSQSIAQIVAINFHRNEYIVEYSNYQYGVVEYPYQEFEKHWILFNVETTGLTKNSVCECGAWAAYGKKAPSHYHFSYCFLYKQN